MLTDDFTIDKQWSDGILPQAKRILGEHLIVEAPREEDVHHATDLLAAELVFGCELRVAVRARRVSQLWRHPAYGDQFTIRSWRQSGVDVELDKIRKGYGSHVLYGFAGAGRFYLWLLGDLNVFRQWDAEYRQRTGGRQPGVEVTNRDQRSKGRAFRIADLPPEFVIARYPPDELREPCTPEALREVLAIAGSRPWPWWVQGAEPDRERDYRLWHDYQRERSRCQQQRMGLVTARLPRRLEVRESMTFFSDTQGRTYCPYPSHAPSDWERPAAMGGGWVCGICHPPHPEVMSR